MLRHTISRSSVALRAARAFPAQPSFNLSTSVRLLTAAPKPPVVPKSNNASQSTGAPIDPVVNDMSNPAGPQTLNPSATVNSASNTAESVDSAPAASTTQIPIEPGKKSVADAAKSEEEAFEIPDKPDLSALPSLDIDPMERERIEAPGSEEEAKESERTKARGKHSLSSIERQRRTLARVLMASALLGGGAVAIYLGSQETPASSKVDTEGDNSVTAGWKRFRANFADLLDYFNKPAFDKLLPDPLPPPHQRPYTLCIDLDDLLVSSTWDRQNGWQTAKRPGVDYFLAYLSQFYEIVLFTAQPLYTALPVAEKLDPFGAYLPYKLFRESTRYVKGKIVKDLSFLNRDLSKVVLLDTKPEHGMLQPENTIIIKPWKGTPGDKGLIDMIPFLESIGIFNPPDVRPIIKAYEGKNIPVEYAKREAERKQAVIEEWERDHGGVQASGGKPSWFSALFGGLGGVSVPTIRDLSYEPVTP